MKIFLAGTTVSNPKKEKKIQQLFRNGHKLHSYFHSIDKGFEEKWFKKNLKNMVDLFLDSGAFSAFTQKVEIDILEYCAFIKEHNIKHYSNLDVIGSAKETYKNQRIMERQGLRPIPVFHYGEDVKWLKRYLKKGYDYISLGGMVPISTPDLIVWLDHLFTNNLTDSKGMPKIKVHGFGLTSFVLMFRYPWYSVDSTSWVVTGRLGSIFIPVFRGGKWDFSKPPLKIAVSSKSPSLKEAGKHISTLSPLQKKILLSYLTDHGYKLGKSEFKFEPQTYELKENERWVGKKPKDKATKREVEIVVEKGISNVYQLRDEMNILYYLELEKHFTPYPWAFVTKHHQKTLF
jgi:hypothetical protein